MNDPLVMSQSNLLPGLSAFSAPTTSAVSHNPEAISENADATAFVPELHKLSIRCETFGRIPSISDKIVELYWSVAQLEKRTASILSELLFFRISVADSLASSNSGMPEFLANFEVDHWEIATLRNLEG
jgi:hypothetical protein